MIKHNGLTSCEISIATQVAFHDRSNVSHPGKYCCDSVHINSQIASYYILALLRRCFMAFLGIFSFLHLLETCKSYAYEPNNSNRLCHCYMLQYIVHIRSKRSGYEALRHLLETCKAITIN
eukprot:945481_1